MDYYLVNSGFPGAAAVCGCLDDSSERRALSSLADRNN
jgi:hypothetical protein